MRAQVRQGEHLAAVVMVGPPVDGRGGMSSVAAAYRDQGLFQRMNVRYVNTMGGRTPLGKLWAAALALRAFEKLLRTGPVRLVHIHISSGPSFWRKAVFVCVAQLRQVPLVLHIHGGNFPEFYAESAALSRWCIRKTFAAARKVIVLSANWIPKVASFVEEDRCVAVGNPVLAWDSGARKGRAIRRFLFLGRFERDKGIYELLEAFASVLQRFPDAELLLGGEGDLEAVNASISHKGLSKSVHLLGWVVGEEKRRVFERADAFVLPSYIEGLPVAMLEAMQCAMPAIVTSVGSIPEVVSHQVNALLIPPRDATQLADAMLQLAADPNAAARIGEAGRELFASNYCAELVCKKIEGLYQALTVNQKGRTSSD
nr:glycosyltransferase family 4 protein [uncultured Roseateles sp.]